MAICLVRVRAPGRIRTCDTRFRKPLLYPLSYEGRRPDRTVRTAQRAVGPIMASGGAGPDDTGRRRHDSSSRNGG